MAAEDLADRRLSSELDRGEDTIQARETRAQYNASDSTDYETVDSELADLISARNATRRNLDDDDRSYLGFVSAEFAYTHPISTL